MMKMQTVIVLLLGLLIGSTAPAGFVQLTPSEDGFVDSANALAIVGDHDLLIVQGFANSVGSFGGIVRSYLKFDLGEAEVPEGAVITEAIFGIYLKEINRGVSAGSDPRVFLYYLSDDTWQEDALNWANAPAFSVSDAFGEAPKPMETSDSGKYHEWNLMSGAGFEWLNYADDLADGFISLVVAVEFEDSNNRAIFYSGDSDVYQPYLKVSYIIPEPATVALLSMGIVGMTPFRKKR